MNDNPNFGQDTSDKTNKDKKMVENEVVDTKIEAAFERLRNDNLYIWK